MQSPPAVSSESLFGISVGDWIDGRYRVDAIEADTRGLLLDAEDLSAGGRVCIRLLPQRRADARELERFRREARALSSLSSAHVARIRDVGMHDDGSCYLVREHVEGVLLAAYLRQAAPGGLPLAHAVDVVLGLAEAVQEVHTRSIALRELQPAHVVLASAFDGRLHATVVDFGSCKGLVDLAGTESVAAELTTSSMMEVSAYASPELATDPRQIDLRTDVWSLGCILYELLTGVPAYGGTGTELFLRLCHDAPPPLHTLRPDLPAELEAIVGWALARDRSLRFDTPYALAHALLPFASPGAEAQVAHIGRLSLLEAMPVACPEAPVAAADVERSVRPQPRAVAPHGQIARLAVPLSVVAVLGLVGLVVAVGQPPAARNPRAAPGFGVVVPREPIWPEDEERPAEPEETEPQTATWVKPRQDVAPPRAEEPPAPEPRAETDTSSGAGGATVTVARSEGVLVVMATRQTCRFSVNGAPHGTGQLRLRLPPGTYRVACDPAAGGSRREVSVRVEAGLQPAVVTF